MKKNILENEITLNNLKKISLILHDFLDCYGSLKKIEKSTPVLENSEFWKPFKRLYNKNYKKIVNSFTLTEEIKNLVSKNVNYCILKQEKTFIISEEFSNYYYQFKEQSTPSVFTSNQKIENVIEFQGIILKPERIKDFDNDFFDQKFYFSEEKKLFDFVVNEDFIIKNKLNEINFSYDKIFDLMYPLFIWE